MENDFPGVECGLAPVLAVVWLHPEPAAIAIDSVSSMPRWVHSPQNQIPLYLRV